MPGGYRVETKPGRRNMRPRKEFGWQVGPEKWKKRQGQGWNGGSQRERLRIRGSKGPLEN